ncbi:acyl-CoA synthetase [Comamonadaceae bacterium G21597-S1]|nr:acyl-CoA synthetase [Comamonadaceae bacterium G21597-S1]
MTQLRQWAERVPDAAAVVDAQTGETLTYGALHLRSARFALHLIDRGATAGSTIAVLLPNGPRYLEVCWAARRAGLYFVPLSTQLKTAEIAHILGDSGARVLLTATQFLPLVRDIDKETMRRIGVIDVDARAEYEAIVDASGPPPVLPHRPTGRDFAYSSGTTGVPKGIRHALDAAASSPVAARDWLAFFQFGPDTTYLCPAPVYHAAPLRFCLRCIECGGTVVIMRRFDAEAALRAIARWRVTHSQWVPTMFVRMLALPQEVRRRHDLSSMRIAVHAAAPCPVHLKRSMLAWWGPILWEYYAGSERNGVTLIAPEEWLRHPGSVGRAVLGRLHIVDDNGDTCAAGVEGSVYFSGGPSFTYHNDPDKTAAAHNAQGWSTIGDIGYVDPDGYLYLTDRRANMIISGGVNIYPQEAENCLLAHPLVADVAVIGVPHAEFGEEVRGIVQLHDPSLASSALALELMHFCRERLSHVKCPRSIDFDPLLPRTETGKLLKRLVRDRYRSATAR